jgi:hypothetical protein
MNRLGLRPVVDNIRLHWWKWARTELQRKNPAHPDLPGIVLKIRSLQPSRSK